MYVALGGPKGKESITVREDYIPLGGTKKKTRIVKNYGPKRLLLAENPNFIADLKKQVREETKSLKERKRARLIPAPSDNITCGADSYQSIRIGHAIVRRLWRMMGLDEFFKEHCTRKNANRVLAGIEYLVCRRLSKPSSIRESFANLSFYAGMDEVALEVLYTILDELDDDRSALIEHLGKYFSKHTDRKLDHVCYDVTNYYFESTKAGELRLFGFSKEHKNNEVLVVMGLLIDSNGIPITFKLFPGNTMDQETLVSAVEDLKVEFGLEEVTVVADRGMNSNENLIFISDGGHHFVISYTLKKASADFRTDCINQDAHPWETQQLDSRTGELVYASKVIDTKCKAKRELSKEAVETLAAQRKSEGKKGRCPKYEIVEIDAKVHVTYSRQRAEKDFSDRERALEKLHKRIDGGKIASSIRYGCNQYLEGIDASSCKIDQEKVSEASKYDGFYAVVTDRSELSTDAVMDIYGEQWKIEDSFRILKTDLEARPVFVWKDERVRGHFTLCYLCLSMIRYIQYVMKEKTSEPISAQRIMNAIYEPYAMILGNAESPYLGASVTDDYIAISTALGLPLLQKTMTPVRFKALTKLDPRQNLLDLVGKK